MLSISYAAWSAKTCQQVVRVFYWCLLEARLVVVILFLLRFLAGASFAGPIFTGRTSFSLWGGAVLWVCVTLSVYILNGIMDVEEDRINNSSRPIASRRLTVAQAIWVAGMLGILSVLGGLILGGLMACSIVAALVLGWLYSGPPFYLKRWPLAWALMGIAAAFITYNAGYLSNGGGGDLLSFSVFACMMASWLGVVSQTKDLSDMEGDERVGRRSVPVIIGENSSRLVFSGVALCLGFAYLLSAMIFAPHLMVPAFLLMVGAAAVAMVMLGSWSRGGRSRRRRPYKVFMFTQYGANLVVLVW